MCSTRSIDGGRTWSKLKPIELPETEEDCKYYNVSPYPNKKKENTSEEESLSSEDTMGPRQRQSHDGYQLLVGDRIYLFYGWNCGSQPPHGKHILSRTDMQLEEGFWMRWSDDFGVNFDGGRIVIPVGAYCNASLENIKT